MVVGVCALVLKQRSLRPPPSRFVGFPPPPCPYTTVVKAFVRRLSSGEYFVRTSRPARPCDELSRIEATPF